MSALFPTVPSAQGVPSVRRTTFAALNDISLLVADVRLLLASPPAWGIYKADGTLAIQPDSFYSIGVRSDRRVSNYPLEQGSFASYNKVRVPSDVRVILTKGGTDQQRRKFLDQVASAIQTFDLLTLVIPEGRQKGYTVHHHDYDRKNNDGVWLLQVELLLQYVMQVPVRTFNSTRDPAGASPQAAGQAQPTSPATVPSGQSTLGQALTNAGTAVVNVADQIVVAAQSIGDTVLSAAGSALSFVGDQLSGLASSVFGASTGTLAPTLLNAGYAACDVSQAAAALIPSVSSMPVSLASALLPQLQDSVLSTAAVSQQLISASSVVSAGGSIDGSTFTTPSTRTVLAPSGSQLAGVLDANPAPVKVGDVSYGPVFPYRVQ